MSPETRLQEQALRLVAKAEAMEKSFHWWEVVPAIRPALRYDPESGLIGFSGTAFCGDVFGAKLVITARHVMCVPDPWGFRVAKSTHGPLDMLAPYSLYWYNDGDPKSPGPWDHASDVAIGVLAAPAQGRLNLDAFAAESPKKGDRLLCLGFPKATSAILYDVRNEPSSLADFARLVDKDQLAFGRITACSVCPRTSTSLAGCARSSSRSYTVWKIWMA